MIRMSKHEYEWLKRKITRIEIEVALTLVLLVFHGMWTVIPLLALTACLLWGAIDKPCD